MQMVDFSLIFARQPYLPRRETRVRTADSPHRSAPPPKSSPKVWGSGTSESTPNGPIPPKRFKFIGLSGLSSSTEPGIAPTLSGPADRLVLAAAECAAAVDPCAARVTWYRVPLNCTAV